MTEKDLLDELGSCEPVPPRPELSEAICRQCTHGLRPARSRGVMTRVMLSLAAALVVVAGFLSTVPATSHWVTPTLLIGVCTLGASSAMVATLVFVGLGRTTLGAVSRPLRRAVTLGVLVLFPVLLLRHAAEWSTLSEIFGDAERRVDVFSCIACTGAIGVSVSAAVLLIWRHTDPFTPGLSGALAGLAGGLTGCVAIGVVCSIEEGWHIGLGHGLAVVTLCVIGWGIGRRLLAP